MAEKQAGETGPDLAEGIALAEIERKRLVKGHVGSEDVLLCASGEDYFAVGASCTHYGVPLQDGLVVGETIRCPLHQACFSLRTGEALTAPAFDPLERYAVHIEDGRIRVGKRQEKVKPAAASVDRSRHPENVVIVGGGAAAFAAAEMLRRKGYDRELIMITEEADAPYDRPNLSKDYLAGTAPEEWIPLKPSDFYEDLSIKLRRNLRAEKLDARQRILHLDDGSTISFDRLLLATGAEAWRPSIPGAQSEGVHTLRSLTDCRKLIGGLEKARSAIVLGAGFLGLEIAASLRARGLAVTVVTPETQPMKRIFGATLAQYILDLHRSHGVEFQLGSTAVGVSRSEVALADATVLRADLVVLATGSRPRMELAVDAGLETGNGIRTDEFLETSAPGIFAAGDVVEWLDRKSNQLRHVEHWSLAQKHAQTAAANMLGEAKPFSAVPFFWSSHYDKTIQFNGYAPAWDEEQVSGSVQAESLAVHFLAKGKLQAAATLGNERLQLELECMLEGELDPVAA